jgi:hypothetical protein
MKEFLKRQMKRLKLDRWIDEGAPMFWVLGMSILFCVAALGILSALLLLLDWRFLSVAISWVIGALAACMVACMVWFVFDVLTAKERPTPWRK